MGATALGGALSSNLFSSGFAFKTLSLSKLVFDAFSVFKAFSSILVSYLLTLATLNLNSF